MTRRGGGNGWKGVSVRRVCLALALIALGCGRPNAADPALRVELDAFSGMPNPSWMLTGAEAAEALRRLRALPTTSAPPPDPGLGYRGFVLTGDSAEGFPGRARVGSGLVVLGEREDSAVHRDAYDLEAFLIERARERGHGAVFEAP